MFYQKIPKTFKRNYILITLIAILVYLFTAFLSEGYYHPDEHFQLLEFANFKRGLTVEYKLPWEYREQIRSSFQPWIAFSMIKILQFTGIENPHIYILILRLITAILSIYVINRFYMNNFKQFNPNYWTMYLLLSYFLWFLPFINVRFSGETWSGLFFIFAILKI
jgi:phosphatidylinositol glycan class B